ncbi:cytochrome c [Sphingomonas quercus]|uniref:Cytochrome c n=1 Tax=Sphingomonas quercus TaxID=2842451 RepID=A0ABS6BPV6_9SPHN|nr:cytochrome c [Sphingomonas quercus]MBU3079240.1 cytochrome c [Sphingomonas quercus]
MSGKILRIAAIGGAAIVAIAAAVGGWTVLGPGPMAFAKGGTVELAAYKGPSPTGVPAALRSASLVKRGEYLARAADCAVCHTVPGGQPYAGGFAFNMPFGAIYSTNITPDKETGIGNYTDAQFLDAVRKGIRPDGTRLYPAMPFGSYTYMTDEDALAIKAYLMSLPPVKSPPRANTLGWPYNQRALLGLWSAAFSPNKRFEPNPEQSPEWNRGAYLAEAMAHCGECHTPRNIGLALNNRQKFAGATNAGWRAHNISSDGDSGIGNWKTEDLTAYLSTGFANSHGVASGPMGEVVDYSLRYLTPDDLKALVTYIRSVPAVAGDLPNRVLTAAPASYKAGPAATLAGSGDRAGERIFAGACAGCHDWTGVSPLSPAATLTGTRSINDPGATNVAQVVIAGVHRQVPQDILTMPAFGHSLNDKEVAAVANYVTARFGAQGSRLTEADVRKLRSQAAQQ